MDKESFRLIFDRARDSQPARSVYVNRNHGLVVISDPAKLHDDISLQGDAAVCFIANASQAWDLLEDVSMNDCYQYAADDYVSVLWY